MKKLICSVLLLLSATTYAQPGPKWGTGGNAISPGEILGTTNNQPLNLVTNNNIRAIIDGNGQFQINNLAGIGDRFLKVNANGSLIAFPNGNATDVLYGNGNWGALPAGATSWQLVGNNLLSTNTGNIGIGTNNPTFKLDIVGSVRISSNLFVGGGIITTSVVNTTSQLNAGDVNATNNLNVNGNSTLSGSLTLPALATGNPNIYKSVFVDAVGNMMVGPNPPEGSQTGCLPNNPSWKIGGNTILGGPYTSEWTAGTCDNYPFVLKSNNVPKIWLTNTAYNGYIGFGTPVPSERYHFSSGNVLIDDLNAGGSAFRTKILAGEQPGFAVETNHTLDDNYNTRLKVNRNGTKALSVINTFADVNGLENFLVYGDGKTNVGWQPGSLNSAKLNVNIIGGGGQALNVFEQNSNKVNFIVYADGKTNVGNETGATNVAKLNVNVNGGDALNVFDQATNNTNFSVKANGDVGIGTSAPTVKLDVVGSIKSSLLAGVGTRMVVTDANGLLSSQAIPVAPAGDNLGNHIATQNLRLNGFTLSHSGTGGIQVNLAGQVGIAGTPDASSALRVNGAFRSEGQAFFINGFTASGPAVFNQNVSASQNVGITGNLNVTGVSTLAGYVLSAGFWTNSDRKYKKNIEELETPLKKLLKIKGVQYEYDTEKFPELTFSEGKTIGFIAQELKEIFPEAVMLKPDGFYSVNYSAIIPVVVEAIKEQHIMMEIKNLEQEKVKSEFEEIKAENASMKNELAAIKTQLASFDNSLQLCCLNTKQNSNSSTQIIENEINNNSPNLEQNTPNPFTENTTINYYLPEKTNNAFIVIYDLQGKQIKKTNSLRNGKGSIIINGGELYAGMFLYTLIIDGKEVATKRMILN